MSEFNIFDQALKNFQKLNIKQDEKQSEEQCLHNNVATEKGVNVCIDCGLEIETDISYDKEWKYYGQGDGKKISDSNRVQMRRSEEKNIFKDVENMGFSDQIVAKANKIYTEVTKGKIFRGNSRKAIVFACIFHAYRISNKPQSHEKLINIFKLNKKTGLRGLKYVNLSAPKESEIRTTYITPLNIIEETMETFDATKEQKKEVCDIYENIKNKSSKINRSRPQSVACGIIFYWITKTGKNISLKEFAKKVILSELTINKISKEISEIIDR